MRRRVGHASAARLRVWAWRGCREAKKRVPRACRCGCGAASYPPATSAGQPTVCVRHTARRTLRGVQLARQGWERGVGEKGARTRCAGGPFRLRILVCVRAIAGLEG